MTKHSRTIQTSQDELLRYLEEGSPFALWNPVEKRELVRNAHDIHLSQGQALYRQGDTAKYVYFVVSGSVKVFVSSVDGDEAIIDIAGKGQWVGELSIIDRQPGQHSVIALEPTHCIGFSEHTINSIMQANPAHYHGITLLLCKHLRSLFSWVAVSMLRSVNNRIYFRLQKLAFAMGTPQDNGFLIRTRISQDLLAAMLGVTRQTLNKELAELKQAGVVKKVGAYYWVRDTCVEGAS